MLIGPNDLKQISLPAAIDAAQLQKLALRNGTTYEKLLTDINDALTLAHNGIFSNKLIRALTYITTDVTVEYRQGAKGGFQEHTEYGESDAKRGDVSGHMLPIKTWDRSLEWSKDYLNAAPQNRLDADITTATDDYETLIWAQVLTRLFSQNAYTGNAWGLGVNGKSVPFCDGGACGIDFTPPNVPTRGFVGDPTHNHYLRLSGKTQANVETAVEHLWEHGHDGPYDMLIADNDIAAWMNKTNVTGFRERPGALVSAGANEALAQVGEEYVGVIITQRGTVRIMAIAQLQADYWNVRKSYGEDDPRNPLYIRVDTFTGEAPRLEVPVAKSLPVEGAIIQTTFGPGVGQDRTSVVCVKDASSGAYTDPIISA